MTHHYLEGTESNKSDEWRCKHGYLESSKYRCQDCYRQLEQNYNNLLQEYLKQNYRLTILREAASGVLAQLVIKSDSYSRAMRTEPSTKRLAKLTHDLDNRKINRSLVFGLHYSADKEITCIYCKDHRTIERGRRPCEYEVHWLDRNSTNCGGIHADCLRELNMRLPNNFLK